MAPPISDQNPMNDSSSSLSDHFDHGRNPYFLHQSDNPSLVLVSQILSGDNYNTWRRSMLMALSAKNKTRFIDASLSRPSPEDFDLLHAWIRSNDMVTSWILNSVSKDIATSLLFHTSAAAVWMDLEERFQQSNGPRLFQLRKTLSALSQGSLSVTAYYTKLKILWDELYSFKPICSCSGCTCGGLRKIILDYQHEYLMLFLMGLNESFAQVRGQILLMDPLPTINKVFSLVIQDEKQREIQPIPVLESIADVSYVPIVAISDQPVAAAITSSFKKPRP